VASRYRPQTQLIGPALFPIYQFVLKLVLLWVLIPIFIAVIGPLVIVPAANRWGAFFSTFSTLCTALFMSTVVITVVFAIIERTTDSLKLFDKWSVRSLPPAPKASQPRSRAHSVFEIVFGFIGLFWLLAIPQYPFLIFGPAASFLKAAPIWHQYYFWIVCLSLFGLAHQLVSLARPQWTWLPSTAKLVNTILTLVLVKYLIDAGMHTQGEWHPYVVGYAMKDAAQTRRVIAVLNLSILLALGSVWLGSCIAIFVQTLEYLGIIHKRSPKMQCAFLPRLKALL
jgi:hypothetical protein